MLSWLVAVRPLLLLLLFLLLLRDLRLWVRFVRMYSTVLFVATLLWRSLSRSSSFAVACVCGSFDEFTVMYVQYVLISAHSILWVQYYMCMLAIAEKDTTILTDYPADSLRYSVHIHSGFKRRTRYAGLALASRAWINIISPRSLVRSLVLHPPLEPLVSYLLQYQNASLLFLPAWRCGAPRSNFFIQLGVHGGVLLAGVIYICHHPVNHRDTRALRTLSIYTIVYSTKPCFVSFSFSIRFHPFHPNSSYSFISPSNVIYLIGKPIWRPRYCTVLFKLTLE